MSTKATQKQQNAMDPQVVNQDYAVTQILDIYKQMAASFSNPQIVQQLLDALDRVPINRAVIKTTMIGKKMTQLAKHSDKIVRDKSQALIAKWKKIIRSEASNKTANTEASSNEDNSSPGDKKVQDRSEVKSENDVKKQNTEIQSADEVKSEPSQETSNTTSTGDKLQTEYLRLNSMSKRELKEYIENNQAKDHLRQSIRVSIAKALLKIDSQNELKIRVISIMIENHL